MISNFMEPKKRGRKPKKEDDSSLGLSSSILTNPMLKTIPIPFALPPALLNLSVQPPLASLASLPSPLQSPRTPGVPRSKSSGGFSLPSPLPSIPNSPPSAAMPTLSSLSSSPFPKTASPASPLSLKPGIKRTLSQAEQIGQVKRRKSEVGQEKKAAPMKDDGGGDAAPMKDQEAQVEIPISGELTNGKLRRTESELPDNQLEEQPSIDEGLTGEQDPSTEIVNDLPTDLGKIETSTENFQPLPDGPVASEDIKRIKRKEKNKIAARKCRAKKQVEIETLNIQVKIQAEEIHKLYIDKVEVVEIMQNLIRLGILDGTNQFQDLNDEDKESSKGLLKKIEDFITRTVLEVQQRQLLIQQAQYQQLLGQQNGQSADGEDEDGNEYEQEEDAEPSLQPSTDDRFRETSKD